MNPAERLLSIYDKLVGQQQDQAMVQTWADVFGLDRKEISLLNSAIKTFRIEVERETGSPAKPRST